MSELVHLMQSNENQRFSEWMKVKSATSAWKVCRQEWQLRVEWLLLCREVWFFGNPKVATVTQLGIFLSSFSFLCFPSKFTHFKIKLKEKKMEKKKIKKHSTSEVLKCSWHFLIMHGENTSTPLEFMKVTAPKAQTFALDWYLRSPKETMVVKEKRREGGG